MKKNHIDFLSESTGIDKSFFPMDIYFLEEKTIKKTQEEDIQQNLHFNSSIKIDKINYEGHIRLVSYSQLSLIINPDEVL
ncbi:MAG: hypothetical protein M9916_04975 [Crocinitomicaceae bacterium]|nr:hypothetical protein [Crocinitomicaceae bacterium]